MDLAIFAQHLEATTPTIEKAHESIPEWVDAISWVAEWDRFSL